MILYKLNKSVNGILSIYNLADRINATIRFIIDVILTTL